MIFIKCPYTVHRHSQSQVYFEYDSEGRTKLQTEIINNNAEMINCVEKDCGAWENGKCNYKGTD